MQETWVQSLGWEDPLEKGMTTHSSILAGELHGLFHGVASQTWLTDFHFLSFFHTWEEGPPPMAQCKESTCNSGNAEVGLIPGSGRYPEGGHGNPQPTLVFLPREFHGQRSPSGYSPWGRRVGRDVKRLSMYIHGKTGTSTPCTVNWDDLGGKQRYDMH